MLIAPPNGRKCFGLPNLQVVREAAGLTQQQLADLIEVEHPTVQRTESGQRETRTEKVFKMAHALNVHPGELFGPLPEQEAVAIARALRAMSEDQLAHWLENGRRLAGMK